MYKALHELREVEATPPVTEAKPEAADETPEAAEGCEALGLNLPDGSGEGAPVPEERLEGVRGRRKTRRAGEWGLRPPG